METLTDEHRRALRLLADSPNGCTEALVMALAMLGDLLFRGLALASPRDSPSCG
jgi:hypothetical protein